MTCGEPAIVGAASAEATRNASSFVRSTPASVWRCAAVIASA